MHFYICLIFFKVVNYKMVSENPLLKWLILFWSGIALIGVININVRLFSTRVGFYT